MNNKTVDFARPVMRGVFNGDLIPISVSSDGKLNINTDMKEKYKLIKVLKIDLSQQHEKELYKISFDSFAVAHVNGNFEMYIDEPTEDKKLSVSKAMCVSVTTDKIYISNASQESNIEIWFFKYE